MDLKTEEIVKILLIIGVLYLLLNCVTTEKFADTEFTRIKLALLSESKPYRLVSFFNLKDEYKYLLLKELHNLYLAETKKNSEISKPEDKTSNTFFAFGSTEDAFINLFKEETEDKINENIKNLSKDQLIKIPVLIISNDKLSEYTTGIFDFAIPSPQNQHGLESDSGRFLFWNSSHNMLFTSSNETMKFEIKGTHSNAEKSPFEIEKIKDKDNNDITPNKIVENTIKIGDKTLTHYILSNKEGNSFVWKWYSDAELFDFARIL
jgi:hypothetical protein